MLKNNHVPSYLMRSDQNGNTGKGVAATSACAGLWIPSTVTLQTLGKKEAWLQEQIDANPSILGLGDLSVLRKERKQPSGGRLDFLLRNDDDSKRFEVEIQLGATNPDHIIRTIEYWDVERRRYPQYSHCGVLVAEEITERFFNVISLLNNSGQMPLMALKLTAIKSPCNNDGIGLLFTKILGEFIAPDESDDDMQPATRDYWIKQSGEQQVAFAEEIFHAIAGDKWSPNPTMRYFGMRNNETDQANAKFAVAPTQRAHVWVRFRMPQSEKWDTELENVVGFVDYKPEPGWSCYRFKSTRANFEQQKLTLRRIFREAVGDGNHSEDSSD